MMNDRQRKAMFANMGKNMFVKQRLMYGQPQVSVMMQGVKEGTGAAMLTTKRSAEERGYPYETSFGGKYYEEETASRITPDELKKLDERDVEELIEEMEALHQTKGLRNIETSLDMGVDPVQSLSLYPGVTDYDQFYRRLDSMVEEE